MTDVEGMFHQVRVPAGDQDLLRFLWWPNGDTTQSIEEYQMTVHLFGATSSPSCANYALRKTADDNCTSYPAEVINTVKKNFYVDDCLKSVATVEEGIECSKKLRDLTSKGGFSLTKWTSNDLSVLESVPRELRSKNVKDLDLRKSIIPNERALGVQWFVSTDTLGYKIDVKERPLTRRGLTSVVSSVYDPLGFAIPFILPAKVLLQDLCREGLGWDDEISAECRIKWQNWLRNLKKLANFSVSRCITPPGFGIISKNEIHHFADASLVAYGAVSYLRSTNERNEVHCSLLMAKSRLAPLRSMTVPRLELAAATVAIQLEGILRRELEIPIQSSTFWTDSTTVTLYLNNHSKRFHTYVANRVAYILSHSTPQQWKYVNSKDNPADDASRGSSLDKFLQNERWTSGPKFLREPETNWLNVYVPTEISYNDPEVKSEIALFQAVNEQEHLMRIFRRFSSWLRLRKFVARCIRWQLKFRNRSHNDTENSQDGSITVQEIKAAEESVLKYLQVQAFPEEIRALRKGNAIKRSSSLIKLDPVIHNGLLRVGGRLNRASLSEDAKNPIILPKKNYVVELIIAHFHCESGHSGREHVLAALRQRFWIINANSMVRRTLLKCFECKRRQATTGKQKMADLPLTRVSPDKPPFSYVGVDYFGPFLVRQRRTMVKRYGVVFTCLAIRAIHVEISNSLDTSSFIMALRRFIARRGQVKQILSDNGTNLVGGNKELQDNIKEWNQKQIHEFLLQKEIEWHFNPPSGSHHGGVWERCIRTIRKLLDALVKEQTLNDEALHTLMCEVESIINSRPITKVSNDPMDLEPLTPNHLLLLRQEPSLPPGIFDKTDLYSRRRWRQVQYLSDLFWKRWTREYLPQLQERQKWNKEQRNFKVGDIVLIVDQSTARNMWPIGRITEVFKDCKGLVRRVKVRTKSTILDRPIVKLCLLETIEDLERGLQ